MSDNTNTPDEGDTGGKRRGPGFGTGWWLSAGVMAVVVLMAAGIFIGRAFTGGNDDTARQSPATVTVPPSGGAPAAPSTGGTASSGGGSAVNGPCPTNPPDGGGERGPVTEVPRTTWQPFGGGVLVVPKTDAGPYVTSNTLRKCYAHTELGAMTAAANTAIGTNSDPTVAKQMMLSQVTPGPARDAGLRNPGGSAVEGDRAFAIRGARVLSYTSTQALVELAVDLGMGGNQLLRVPMVMLWSGGDWKLNGASTAQPQALPALDGFLRWEAGQ